MRTKLSILCLLMAALMLVGCTSKEEMLQQRVQSMAASAELGTVEYTVKKIVKCDDKQTFAIGDRKILFRSTAYLKAGVDLAGFTANNVQIDGKNVTVTLPHAKLLSFNMPAEETSTVFENYGFFRSHFSPEERNYIMRLGEKDIRDDVPNLGILDEAEQNVKEIFTALLSQMGFQYININFVEE